MASTNVCWGLEIGAASVKALKLERVDESRIKVLDYAVIQHPKVLSTPGVDANDVIRVSLGQLISQFDFSKAGLAVSVPGHAAFARFTKLPPVEPKKVPDIVKFEAVQQIPFPLEEVEWDYQTFISPDSPDVGVGIFAIRKDNVRDRLALLTDVGLTPDVLTLSPLAVYNALAHDLTFDDKTPGTIIVDVGTTSTDIVIAEPGRMWVRTFPIGGHQFTDALVQQFQLSYPKAEKLKREAEDTKHARQVFQAMRPVFTDLATEIQRSIGYYQALHKDSKLARLIGVGSTFRLPGLRKYLKQQLTIEVYRVEEFKKAQLAGAEKAPEGQPETPVTDRGAAFNEASLNLVTAYGLALQGLGMNACGGNLMPVAVVRESMWRSKAKPFAAAAGLAIAASAALFGRPILNHFQTKSVPPPVIGEAIRKASELKSAADSAGVTGSAQADYRAANIVDLLKGRDMYARLVDDVGQMFEAADQKAAPAGGQPPVPLPAYSLSTFETEYEAPAAAPAEGAPPSPAADRGSDAPADVVTMPRVKCTLTMMTDMPEPRRFAEDTLVKWLREHAERAGVPYKLAYNTPAIKVEESAAPPPGTAPPPPGPRGGRGGTVIGEAGESGRRGMPRTSLPEKPIIYGGPAPTGPAPAPVEPELAPGDMDREYPLPPPPPLRRAKVTLTYWAGVPAAKKEGGPS